LGGTALNALHGHGPPEGSMEKLLLFREGDREAIDDVVVLCW